MANSTFNRCDVVVADTRTQLYPSTGAVPANTTVIIFSGFISNKDSTNKSTHSITLEILKADGTTYISEFPSVPIPWGGVSEMPKLVLLAGEKLYATADVPNVVTASVSVVERS